MWQLPKLIPNPDALLVLEPEELAEAMIFILKESFGDKIFHPQNMRGEVWGTSTAARPTYNEYPLPEIDLAIAEAWAWLNAQGLIVSAPETNGSNGWMLLSRRARRFQNTADFGDYKIARRLPKDMLHPLFADNVWKSFMRSEFDTAVFQAMKAVEVAVREAAHLGINDIGVNLMRKAFNPKDGPLTDLSTESGEREALSALFAGAIGSYKNPHSHRNVPLDDPSEAAQIVMLASHLLGIVEARGQLNSE